MNLKVCSDCHMEQTDYFLYSILGFADPVSSWTHLIGSGVALVMGIRLCLHFQGPALHKTGLITFVSGTVFMFSMSGVYHILDHDSSGRYVLQHLDHAAIWVMIAGTFTPIHLMLFQGWKRWGILFFIWAAAINGIVLKTVFFDDFSEWFSLILYLGMGWAGIFSGILIAREHSMISMHLLAYGGIAYSVGAIIEFLRSPIIIPGVLGPHELFHFAIIIGVMCHWRFIEHTILMSTAEITESE
ncbi:MAG: hemolysin III family protein [Candidatus Thalassarchaeaceae archaeon]|nr:hemolysin III family protein [Candidatus Thalassarchaeaceae archaeon]